MNHVIANALFTQNTSKVAFQFFGIYTRLVERGAGTRTNGEHALWLIARTIPPFVLMPLPWPSASV